MGRRDNQGQPPPPLPPAGLKPNEAPEPSRSRPTPNRTGIGAVLPSKAGSPLGEEVTRKYPGEGPEALQKSLYSPGHLGPPLQQIGQRRPYQDQGVQTETTINIEPEAVASEPPPIRIFESPIVLPSSLRWNFPQGFGARQPAATLRPRCPECRALVISNNEPIGHNDRLKFAEADVDRFVKCLIEYIKVKKEKIRVVKTEGNVDYVKEGFTWFFDGVVPKDTLILFISAHIGVKGLDDLVNFFHYNAEHFFIRISSLPPGCSLEILLDTCFGTKLIRLEHVLKQMWNRSTSIILSPNVPTDTSFSVATASSPLAETPDHSTSARLAEPGLPADQTYRPTTARASRRVTQGLAAAPPCHGSVSSTRPAHSQRRSPGPDHAVVAARPLPAFTSSSNTTKADVTLWAFNGYTYESAGSTEEPARGGILSNAICTALGKFRFYQLFKMGKRARSAIWDILVHKTSIEDKARAERDLYKTPEELAKLAKEGPRDQCPQLRSTCNDPDRVLEGKIFHSLRGGLAS